MPSTFFGLQIASNALSAEQLAIDVTGQNISNASNSSYTRQVANLTATTPYNITQAGGTLSLGTGVTMSSVTRARDSFVDMEYRNQNALENYWSTRQDGFNKIQGIMNEPSSTGLSSTMDSFWSDFSSLANNPQDSATRTVVQEGAVALAQQFNSISSQLTDLSNNTQQQLAANVSEVNSYAQQISQLDIQIKNAQVNGNSANDLLDQRDKLIDQISQYFNVSVVETPDPSFTDRVVNNFELKIGNNDLVNGSLSNTIQAPTSGTDVTWDTVNTTGANAPTAGSAVNSGDGSGGETGTIKSEYDLLNYISQLQSKYDSLAKGIADAVNSLQSSGYDLNGNTGSETGVGTANPDQTFFTYTNSGSASSPSGIASSLAVNSQIANDPSKIAAATTSINQPLTTGTVSVTVNSTPTPQTYTYTVTSSDLASSNPLNTVLSNLQTTSGNAFIFSINNDQVQITNQSGSSITFGQSSDTSNALQVASLSGLSAGASGSTTATVTGGNYVADGSNAQNIASLKDGWAALSSSELSTLAASNNVFNSASLADNYNSMVSGVGTDGQTANTMTTNAQSMVSQLSNQRQTVSGVSLDEEMLNMLTYQKSYSAAARLVTTMDDMLNTLVTGMGVTR